MFFVYLISVALFTMIFTREVIAPASGAACNKRWRILAGALNAFNTTAAIGVGFLFAGWISQNSLFTLSLENGIILNSLIVFLVTSFLAYWWHRLCHKSDFLWRTVHQLHHSPSRIEVLTAFYAHPLDSFAATLLNACVAYLILGVNVETAALALLYVSIFNFVAHADQKTPEFLSWFIQRPEMHRLHHERDVHAGNYGLPLWDRLFGTYKAAPKVSVTCGFHPDNEYRLQEMLKMKVVE